VKELVLVKSHMEEEDGTIAVEGDWEPREAQMKTNGDSELKKVCGVTREINVNIVQCEKTQDETKRRLMSEGAVQKELNRLQGNSIYGAAPHSTVCKDRQRYPSPNQHAMMNNPFSRRIQVQTKNQQAIIKNMVMVGHLKLREKWYKDHKVNQFMEAFSTDLVDKTNMKAKHLNSFQHANKRSTNAIATMQNNMYEGNMTYLQ